MTIIKEVSPGFFLLRANDREPGKFEALWDIPEGITYNAYVLKTSGGAVLFDTWHEKFSDEFLKAVESVVDPREISTVVVHHAEPDHSGSLGPFLEVNDRVKVRGSPMAKRILASRGLEFDFQPAQGEESVGDKKLKFLSTPQLHWPETMMTYLPSSQVLLTGDVFGAFSIPDVFGGGDDYTNFARKYFADVIGNFRGHVKRTLPKLDMPLELIAPAHGTLWRNKTLVDKYAAWASGELDEKKAVVVYSSMYGSTKEAALMAESTLEEQGYETHAFGFTKDGHAPFGDILGEAIDAGIIVIASQTYENGIFPTLDSFLDLFEKKAASHQKAVIITSYGWGDMASKALKERLEGAGLSVQASLTFQGSPDESDKKKVRSALVNLQSQ